MSILERMHLAMDHYRTTQFSNRLTRHFTARMGARSNKRLVMPPEIIPCQTKSVQLPTFTAYAYLTSTRTHFPTNLYRLPGKRGLHPSGWGLRSVWFETKRICSVPSCILHEVSRRSLGSQENWRRGPLQRMFWSSRPQFCPDRWCKGPI